MFLTIKLQKLLVTYVYIEESDVNIALDDITKIDELIEIAHKWYLNTNDEVLRDIFDLFNSLTRSQRHR